MQKNRFEGCLGHRFQWILLALLWLLYAAFGLVSSAISPLITPILKDLAISFSQMGFILGSWQLTYIMAALAAGPVIDRWGVRKSLFVGVVIIGLSAGLRYYAHGFFSLMACVALFGCGGPMISIGGPKAISQWFDTNRRGTAIGIYTTGSWVGGLLALALTNSLVMPLLGSSWRAVFMCYGVFALGVAALWVVLARERQSNIESKKRGIYEVLGHLVKVRNVQVLLLMALFSFAIEHGFTSWLPKILENSGMSASQAGYAAAIPIASGILGILIIPHFLRPDLRGRFVALGALINAASLVVAVRSSGIALIIALMAIGFISSPFMPLMLLIMMDTPGVGPHQMGSAGGMFFCVAEIGGFTGPLMMGVMFDLTGGFVAGTIFLASLCLALAGLTVLLRHRHTA